LRPRRKRRRRREVDYKADHSQIRPGTVKTPQAVGKDSIHEEWFIKGYF
jgi:hypothetical protein